MSGCIAAMSRLQSCDLIRRRAARDRIGPPLIRSLAQASARRASGGPGDDLFGIEMQHGHCLLGVRDLLQGRLRTTPRKARRRRPPTGAAGPRARFHLAGSDQRPGKTEADAGSANRQAMIQRDTANGFQIAVEYGVDDGSANAFPATSPGGARMASTPRESVADRPARPWSGSGAPAPAPGWNRASG